MSQHDRMFPCARRFVLVRREMIDFPLLDRSESLQQYPSDLWELVVPRHLWLLQFATILCMAPRDSRVLARPCAACGFTSPLVRQVLRQVGWSPLCQVDVRRGASHGCGRLTWL
ncbi:hypothetical protein B296_00042993 [Ensete ventricosum]|uniref:Uncharacterized protein n=1 Tax=Ensete ventricosum TaxID=4639 RepID=A0A426ZGG4_ENSVE|nr:hypothetical protein B296_00042993 [Ensete ventricosum]